MRIKDIIFCWDFLGATFITLILYLLLPKSISQKFVKDISSVAISVLSIVFSIFFAALAIIISSGEDKFIRFMEENNDYTAIVETFKYSMVIIFIALFLSLIYYGGISYLILQNVTTQPKSYFIVFCFLFIYSLFTALNTIFDAITFSQYRTKFLKINER